MNALTLALSAALIHAIWQGALIGWALWIALVVLRNRSARSRYAVSCIALFVLAAAFLFTVAGIVYLHAPPAGPDAMRASASPGDLVGIPQPMLPIWIEPDAPHFRWLAWVQLWALPVWSAGVLIFSLRLVFGCAQAFTLGHRGEAADRSILTSVSAVARRMGIMRPVRVLMSTLSDGPSVLGWLRPVILIPPAAMTGLSPEQLEAVIAHELAHVTRHDYVVNVIQSVVEAVLFFHPITWWISKQIRIERELCCDDLAVESCGDALGYAQALVKLAKIRLALPQLAMASTGGSLLHRIQRLLGAPAGEYGRSRWQGLAALCLGLACVGLSLNRVQLLAQTDADAPRFEVASVKVNHLDDGQVHIGSQGGRYTATGVYLRELIRMSYQVQNDQILGGPRWMDTERFDVAATEGPRPADRADSPNAHAARELSMLRALLAERFQLAVHRETRDRPIYMLTLARRDGRVGPELHKVDVDCTKPESARRNDGWGCGGWISPGFIRGSAQTMAELAATLSNTGASFARPVVDRTGLTGVFDFTLRFTPDRIPDGAPNGLPISVPSVDPNAASIFTAIQEQLGLKLDSQRGPVDVLVIDRAEKPTEN